uniref:Uncharacterized protein n=1 Tax=Lygus hesperus TaxID=30085 RepID=A0A0K8SYM7_LYGHE
MVNKISSKVNKIVSKLESPVEFVLVWVEETKSKFDKKKNNNQLSFVEVTDVNETSRKPCWCMYRCEQENSTVQLRFFNHRQTMIVTLLDDDGCQVLDTGVRFRIFDHLTKDFHASFGLDQRAVFVRVYVRRRFITWK